MFWSTLSLFLSLQRPLLLGTQTAESLGFGREEDKSTNPCIWRGLWGLLCPSSFQEMLGGGLDATKKLEVCNGPFLCTISLAHYPVNTNAAFRMCSLLPTLKLILTYRRRRQGWKQKVFQPYPRTPQVHRRQLFFLFLTSSLGATPRPMFAKLCMLKVARPRLSRLMVA